MTDLGIADLVADRVAEDTAAYREQWEKDQQRISDLERSLIELAERHNAVVARVLQLERQAKPVLQEHSRYGL